MLDHAAAYPAAVTSRDDAGVQEGIRWCVERMEAGDRITVWTPLKRTLDESAVLKRFVTSRDGVRHVTRRGGGLIEHCGSVLMAGARLHDIPEFVNPDAAKTRALCVVPVSSNGLDPWIAEVRPNRLGNTTAWEVPATDWDPVVVAGMCVITDWINHSNSILAGADKDDVVRVLLALWDAGYALDGPAMAAWAINHGWTGRNPKHLEDYVSTINGGGRPRMKSPYDPGFIEHIRSRVARAGEE